MQQQRQLKDHGAGHFSTRAGISTLLQPPAISALTYAMATGHSHAS